MKIKYSEEVLADLRNKLNPACNLVALVEEYFMSTNKMRSLEEIDYLMNTIKKQLPKAKESFEYVRNYKVDKGKEFTVNDIEKAFKDGRLYECDLLELESEGKNTATVFEIWYENFLNK